MSISGRIAKLIASTAVLFLALAPSALHAAGDFQFDVSLRKHKSKIFSWLEAKQIPAGEEQLFDEFFNRFALVEFFDPKQKTNLPKVRSNIAAYFRAGKSGPPYARLNELTRKRMIDIIKEPGLDEVIKYNAMLVLGELNGMLPMLAKVAVNPKAADSLRVAALVGVQRQAAAGKLNQTTRDALTKLMIPLVMQDQPPGKRSPEGHAWIRNSAARVLATLHEAGTNAAVVTALAAGIDDEEAPHFMRCGMAESLGEIVYPAGAKIDFEKLAISLGWLVRDATRAETDRSDRLGGGSPEIPSRPLLINRLHAVLVGYEGPQGKTGLMPAAAKSPAKSRIDEIHAKVRALYATVLDTKTSGPDLYNAIMPKLKDLESSLPQRGSVRKAGLAGETDPNSDIRGARAQAAATQPVR